MNILNNIIDWKLCSIFEKKKLMNRPYSKNIESIRKKVNEIIQKVKNEGDKALHYYNNILDNIKIKNLKITEFQINKSYQKTNQEIKSALYAAIKNIKKFHLAQKTNTLNVITQKGIYCQQIHHPIDSVGLYIPGGIAPLFSTVLMLAIPAKIAGCKKIVICSPPPISDKIICAAKLCGIKNIFQIGGAQAIAALAIGTQSVPKVDKIFGPGNIWVTEAKKQVNYFFENISIDMPAGPSELMIIADENSDPDFIASDLLSQAEHGYDSQVILLTTSKFIAQKVINSLKKQIINLPRIEIIKKSLKNGYIILISDIQECIEICNTYAPEHLIIQTKNSRKISKYIKNAGSIFLGKWTPESLGDYASGTNHVLPTSGYSKTYSCLGVADFQKRMTIQKTTPKGLLNIFSTVEILAKEENLIAHKNAVTLRIRKIQENKKYEF